MKHRIIKKGLALLLLLVLLTGCAPASAGTPDSAPAGTPASVPAAPAPSAAPDGPAHAAPDAAISFTDDLGRTVTVEHPRRVAALIGSFADIWCLAGGGDTLAATANDAWTSFEGLPLDGVSNIGSAKAPNLEAILAAEPDFILASPGTAADLALEPTLTELGIPTAWFEVSSFEDYLRMLELCTRITGDTDAYRQYGLAVQAQIDACLACAAEQEQPPTVLYIRVSASGCQVKNSEGNVLGEMLRALGCVNIADSDSALLESLSMEAILAADPDHIFLVYQSSDPAEAEAVADQVLRGDPAWASLRAVQQGSCHLMDQRLYNLKPNARWGDAYEQLTEILYPQA